MSSTAEAFEDMSAAAEFFKNNPPDLKGFPVQVPVEVVNEGGVMRYVTPDEFAARDDEDLLEQGFTQPHINALRAAVAQANDPVQVGVDDYGVLRFKSIESKEYSLENRETVEAEIREYLTHTNASPDKYDEIVETMFTTRTLEEPAVVPTGFALYGRDPDSEEKGESEDILADYSSHMEDHWGF